MLFNTLAYWAKNIILVDIDPDSAIPAQCKGIGSLIHNTSSCIYAECWYAEFRKEVLYAKCRYADCCYTECRGAIFS